MSHIKRHARDRLLEALNVSPVVFLNGPRQAGKSTLVQSIAKKDYPAEYVTFDSTTQMAAAANSPESYLKERKGALIIDEVQLVPEIFRALKVVVDELRLDQPKLKGRFLLTGSANIMALPKLSDPLVGRMSVLTLYPLAASEAMGGKGNFVERLFNKDFEADSTKQKLAETIRLATYPEISGSEKLERTTWFDGYLTTILQRDVRALAEIEKLSTLPNLLRILANRAGGLVNDADIARDAGLNPVTSRNYKTLLKMLFLTFELAPWSRNIGKRLVKSPKGYMSDTLLLCHLMQYELSDLEQNRPELFGHVLENFVATELLKLMTFQNEKMDLYHFRTSDNKEVDFVLEKSNGQLAAVEVKQRDSVSKADFKGLEELQRLAGHDFICGIVLYRGRDVVPFGQNLWAVPVSNLWL
ncbi:MAG TPA: ATP-binding protein [Micavibrio sp.]|nr:ATP-binding protein [Rhodospirillales bacterium]HIL29191.1 ATP-binding protein [Micavibrio sp.]